MSRARQIRRHPFAVAVMHSRRRCRIPSAAHRSFPGARRDQWRGQGSRRVDPMVVRFVRDETAEVAAEDASTLNELPAPPRQLLDRHGARVLDPATSTAVPGRPAPRTTVYRPGAFLIPNRYLRDQETLAAINRVLARIGLYAEPADRGGDSKEAARARQLEDLPVRALLHVREDSDPVVVDCWKAVQLLRRRVGGRPAGDRRRRSSRGSPSSTCCSARRCSAGCRGRPAASAARPGRPAGSARAAPTGAPAAPTGSR